MTDTVKPAVDVLGLALTLAYEYATAVVECHCVNVTERAGEPGVWFELPKDASALFVSEQCDQVRYLEGRGLLLRHPLRADWVSLLDESEATR